LTPEYTIEASTYYVKDAAGNVLHNPDGSIQIVDSSQWLRNAETGKLLVDVSHDGTIHFLGDDNFLGNTVVMGGTAGDDKILSGNADDDTIYGDAVATTVPRRRRRQRRRSRRRRQRLHHRCRRQRYHSTAMPVTTPSLQRHRRRPRLGGDGNVT
jgi:hypothetical protein